MKIVYDIEIEFQGSFKLLEAIEGAKIIPNGKSSKKLAITNTD
jgi:hypothetical protein